jgi:negative regulator of sigma E activity
MKDEVESQLSAMFDGELPAAECELLSRRIDRDERLRARWARYVLIGASMRYEPVATASSGFAARVGAAVAALDGEGAAQPSARRFRLGPPNWVWQSALAAALVVAVAGLSIQMLRNAALTNTAVNMTAASSVPPAHSTLSPSSNVPVSLTASAVPWSYVTPAGNERPGAPMPLRSQLTDYIVAHSEYSTPLMRPDLLSALVGGEQGRDAPSGAAGANASGTDEVDASAAASTARQ